MHIEKETMEMLILFAELNETGRRKKKHATICFELETPGSIGDKSTFFLDFATFQRCYC